ncbi:MarR family transcriptional regulator [Dehalococcoides mccartyi CG4]|uniref:MarR family winged helix-turn-helix transcriptional regulator n=1 Tax=Dehalococcoides mccartyi TaxID=61435 RepID=UPI0004E07543|nr:MarR family transcriptional regulator [Dehalococcoides mccartyi]AII60049.1 MarR family transcriptional regulator [Dehalococcoides mccartyi CG4]
MNKAVIIDNIIKIEGRIGQTILPYAMNSWCKLDVPLAQMKSLFIIIGKGEMNLGALAQSLGVTPGDVTGIVERLVEQGLISRKPGAEDRRVTWLSATDKGRALVTNLVESKSEHMADILEHMSLDGLVSLEKGLKELISAIRAHQQELG